jgi:hypothetical protein
MRTAMSSSCSTHVAGLKPCRSGTHDRQREAATEPMTPADIGFVADLPKNTVDQQLYKMVTSGEVIKMTRAKYAHPDKAATFRAKQP